MTAILKKATRKGIVTLPARGYGRLRRENVPASADMLRHAVTLIFVISVSQTPGKRNL
jgi:hypothetical protein